MAALRGQVVLLGAFQMRCPGCTGRSLPQLQRVAQAFAEAPLVVVGLHSVFEDHEAMRPEALKAFVREQGLRFPVGLDAPDPSGGHVPLTMQAYGMSGTPTTVLIDAEGRRRRQLFGVLDDLVLGAELQSLLLEATGWRPGAAAGPLLGPEAEGGAEGEGCALP